LESIKKVSDKLLTLVPGVRPEGTSKDDQARIMTPGQAKKKGADFIVIGRPILLASDPLEALTAIKGEVACS
jgi:orotidine-5'-phosphate decarboxylase